MSARLRKGAQAGAGLLGDGLLGSGGDAGPARPLLLPWSTSAWDVDASGYAVANPTLGSELFANGAFDSNTVWGKGTGWTIAGGVAVGSPATSTLAQNVLPDATAPYVFTFDVVTRTAGAVRMHLGAAIGHGSSTVGAQRYSARGQGSTFAGFNVATSFTGTVDNASLKQVTGNPQAMVEAANPSSVAIRLPINAPGHELQLRYGANDASAPIHYLTARVLQSPTADFRVGLLKFVNGVQTGIVGTADVTFVANARLEIRRLPSNVFQLWYNNIQVGTNQTVNDVEILDSPYHGFWALTSDWRIGAFYLNNRLVAFDF